MRRIFAYALVFLGAVAGIAGPVREIPAEAGTTDAGPAQARPSAAAQEIRAKWAEATEAYQKRDFEEARKAYENLLAEDVADANLYYNLGNVYCQLGQRGKAAWMYERALKAAPRHADARKNLRLARAGLPPLNQGAFILFQPLAWLCGLLTASEWAGLLLGVSLATSLPLSLWILLRRGLPRRLAGIGAAAGLGVSVLIACFFAARYADVEWRHYGVITESGAIVRNAPSASADKYFEAAEGERYLVEDSDLSGWLRVTHPATGRVGYLPESVVGRI